MLNPHFFEIGYPFLYYRLFVNNFLSSKYLEKDIERKKFLNSYTNDNGINYNHALSLYENDIDSIFYTIRDCEGKNIITLKISFRRESKKESNINIFTYAFIIGKDYKSLLYTKDWAGKRQIEYVKECQDTAWWVIKGLVKNVHDQEVIEYFKTSCIDSKVSFIRNKLCTEQEDNYIETWIPQEKVLFPFKTSTFKLNFGPPNFAELSFDEISDLRLLNNMMQKLFDISLKIKNKRL